MPKGKTQSRWTTLPCCLKYRIGYFPFKIVELAKQFSMKQVNGPEKKAILMLTLTNNYISIDL